ncbi:MAG: bifunctional folylpolyglutamate synthase/dihydrofolate synthase [Dehalococcoidia bacterium]
MDYEAALKYILGFTDFERSPAILYSAANFDLRRMEELLGRLDNPHSGARSIHVAGTKGKGSTVAMIASALGASGYRTGLYTSPHLHTFRERISIDGEFIAEGALAAIVQRLKPEVDAVNRRRAYGELTTFEILTAIAFTYFREREVDFQVLEVGLGGRLDATNVVQAEVSVITSISLDHAEALGDSLAKIAGEKAGIIKPGAIVVTSPQRREAAEVIEEACRQKGARLIAVGRDVTWKKLAGDLGGQSLLVKGQADSYNLTIPLLGDHQLENAAIAVAALEALGIPAESIAAGLGKVHWPGRMEILRHAPLFVVDGAHNADSARRLREAIEKYFNFERLILIIGASCDKDIAGIAGELASLTRFAIVTRSRHPRALAPSSLLGELTRRGVRAEVAESVAVAARGALGRARPRDLICATGSLFIAAEAIEYIKGIRPELYP